jgi:hypothetical protein
VEKEGAEGQLSRAASPYWWTKKGLRGNSLEQLHCTCGKRRGGGAIILSSFTVLVAKEGVEGQFSRAASLYWWKKKGGGVILQSSFTILMEREGVEG